MGEILNRDYLRSASAELIATFLFVLVGVGAIGAFQKTGAASGSLLLVIGFAHGLGIAVGVAAIGRISGGHINPVVTVAALVTGNIGLINAAMYILAQLGGAVLAVFALDMVAYQSGDVGLHALAADVSVRDGFFIEVMLTFILVFVVFATAIDKRANAALAPLAIGSTVALGHFVAIPLTGASMNPARSLAPALVHSAWSDHWIYWVAPLAGAIIAAITYVAIFGSDKDRRSMRITLLTKRDSSSDSD